MRRRGCGKRRIEAVEDAHLIAALAPFELAAPAGRPDRVPGARARSWRPLSCRPQAASAVGRVA